MIRTLIGQASHFFINSLNPDFSSCSHRLRPSTLKGRTQGNSTPSLRQDFVATFALGICFSILSSSWIFQFFSPGETCLSLRAPVLVFFSPFPFTFVWCLDSRRVLILGLPYFWVFLVWFWCLFFPKGGDGTCTSGWSLFLFFHLFFFLTTFADRED